MHEDCLTIAWPLHDNWSKAAWPPTCLTTTKCAGWRKLNKNSLILKKFLRILIWTVCKTNLVTEVNFWVGNSNDSNSNVLHLQLLRSLNWGCENLILFLFFVEKAQKIEREVLLHRESKKAEQTQLLFSSSKNKSRRFYLTPM